MLFPAERQLDFRAEVIKIIGIGAEEADNFIVVVRVGLDAGAGFGDGAGAGHNPDALEVESAGDDLIIEEKRRPPLPGDTVETTGLHGASLMFFFISVTMRWPYFVLGILMLFTYRLKWD